MVTNEEEIKKVIRDNLVLDTLKENLLKEAESSFDKMEPDTLGESRLDRRNAFIGKATTPKKVRLLLERNYKDSVKKFPVFKNFPQVLLRIMRVRNHIILDYFVNEGR